MAVAMNTSQKVTADAVRDLLNTAETSAKAARTALGDAVVLMKAQVALEIDAGAANQANAIAAFGIMGTLERLRGQASMLLGQTIEDHAVISAKLAATFTDAGTTIQGGGGGRKSI